MITVSNKRCIRRLGFRALRAACSRNIIAVLAIALTTVLFTSLFTIAASINDSYQQENFRRAGADIHGTFKDITWEQAQLLRDDALIVESCARMYLGMPADPPFHKAHVEVSYIEPQGAAHYFCTPEVGALPAEGTRQAAADTRILGLLGVEPEIGAEFTISFYIDENTPSRRLVTRTYTLSGWWEFDSASIASHLLVPRSEAESIAALSSREAGAMTGVWTLDVMFQNALNIRENLLAVLERHGFQDPELAGKDPIGIGVNWGYTGVRFSGGLSAGELLAIAALILLIVFTGYLIIYNVFQISVTNDIRFYGMLKAIGATGRQLKRIIRQQALLLSLAGIPLGLLLGFFIGNRLTPVIMAQLSYTRTFVSFDPRIFLGAAAFSLLTVFLSCARPGRMAARVSPIEALRYTGGGTAPGRKAPKKRTQKRSSHGASLPRMAWANLSRSRGKTAVTVISLTLAVVLACLTYTFSIGFDLDKYLASSVASDFIVGHVDYFQAHFHGSPSSEVSQDILSAVRAQDGITDSGRVYGCAPEDLLQPVTEAWYRQNWEQYAGPGMAEMAVQDAQHLPDGRLLSSAMLYGMEPFPLSLLTVTEGDLAPLSDPAQNAIAAVCVMEDGAVYPDSVWAHTGDTVTLRFVEEWIWYYTDTGEDIAPDEDADPSRPMSRRAASWRTAEYTVCAVVAVPQALSYRYTATGSDSYVLGAQRFLQDTGTNTVMAWACNTTSEANAALESFLARYTQTVQPEYDYESKATCTAEFRGFQRMFLVLGGTLSFIIGLVGVLNFVNAILTGILTRKREFAALQSIGMTGKQLKTMLVCEGLYYTLFALLLALALTLASIPLMQNTIAGLFWFFTYRFTAAPILLLTPVFAVLGAAAPLAVYRFVARRSIVERLREAED